MRINTADLQRTHFTIGRAAEYFNAKELEAQTGQPRRAFASVVLKELVDNGLDAAETTDVAPEIEIVVERDDAIIRLRVADNGPGLAPEILARILDFDTRTSDKSRYRAPTRGAQGNALKTVIGIPTSLGGDAPIIIDACGQRHTIRPKLDTAGNVDVDHVITSGLRTVGTEVLLTMPAAGQTFDPGRWARAFALSNPHATISVKIADRRTVIEHAQSDASVVDDSYQKRVDFPDDWRKWRPSDPTSPHWYDRGALTALVDAEIAHGRATKSEGKLLRDFVREFRGLTGTAKAKQVCESLPHAKRVGDLNGDVGRLLTVMQSASTPPKPGALGAIGEEPIRACVDQWHGIWRHWYRQERVLNDGIPIIVESFVAETDTPGGLTVAINHSPTYADPLARYFLRGDKAGGYGVAGLLDECTEQARRYASDLPTWTMFVHIISPSLIFLDRGKGQLEPSPALVEAATKAIWHTVKTAWTEGEQWRKDANRAWRRHEAEERARTRDMPKTMTLKAAAFAVMEGAWAKATGNGTMPASARTVYYQARPLMQGLTDRAIGDDYFTQNLLPEYEREVRKLPGVYYEPRGHLHEPHGGRTIPLGTQDVEGYTLPPWRFDKILFVEKTGLWPVLEQAQLGERFDMAIVAGNGFASVAARPRPAASAPSCTIFVLHDADPAGYNIAATIAEETSRMPGHRIDVIDIGLTLGEAEALGLESETFARNAALPVRLLPTLGEIERQRWKADQPKAKGCERVELNAMTSTQLVDHIIAALERYGATAKVVPDAATITAEAASRIRAQVSMRLDELLRDLVDLNTIAATIGAEIAHKAEPLTPEAVRAAIEPARPIDWRTSTGDWAARTVKDADDMITQALRTALERVA
jgi:anti-sigma regulatory factor (Ser/Thr protein kinase)